MAADAFDRAEVGPAWETISGSWSIAGNRLVGSGLVLLTRGIAAPSYNVKWTWRVDGQKTLRVYLHYDQDTGKGYYVDWNSADGTAKLYNPDGTLLGSKTGAVSYTGTIYDCYLEVCIWDDGNPAQRRVSIGWQRAGYPRTQYPFAPFAFTPSGNQVGLSSSSTVTVDDFDLDRRHADDCPSCFTWCAHCRDGAIPNCLKIEVAGLADRADAGWPSNAGHNDFWPTCTVCGCFNGVYYGQWYYDYLNTTRCGVYLSWYNCYLTTTVEGYGANRRLTVNVVKENDIYYLRGEIEYETVRWEKELGTELPDCRAFDNEVLTLVNPGGDERMCDYVGSTLTVSSVSSGCPTPVRIMCPAVCIDCYNAPEELEIVIGGPLRTRDGPRSRATTRACTSSVATDPCRTARVCTTATTTATPRAGSP